MKKRMLSLLLVLVMVLGMFPVTALATEEEPTPPEIVETQVLPTEEETEPPALEPAAPAEEEAVLLAAASEEVTLLADSLPVLLGVNVTLADILDTSNGWLPYLVDKSAVFETGTGTASLNFSNSVLYTNGSFSTPAASKGAGGKYYFYITVTSLPEYYPVDYSKISLDHINVTMYDYKVDFLYTSEYSSGAYTGMKFCFTATHNPAPKVMFGSVELKDGYYLQSGTSIISTTKPSGGYAYYYDGVLELNNYNSSSFSGLVLWDLESINIRVVGSNVLSKIEERYTSVNTQKYTDIAFTGDGSLTVSSNTANCVKTTGDVTVDGGSLTFGGGNALSGLSAASLTVNGGELVLKGTTSAINSGCAVKMDNKTVFVDEENTIRWLGSQELSSYKYLRFTAPQVRFSEVVLKDGYYLQDGTSLTSTRVPAGDDGYAYYKDGVLELNNYNSYSYAVLSVEGLSDIEIKLIGENELNLIKGTSTGSYTSAQADITFTGDGSLNVSSNVPACVTTGGDVTVNGGTLTFGGGNGLSGLSAASLTVNRGELVLQGKNYAINSGCRVDADLVYVDKNNTLWDGTTALSTYQYLRFSFPHINVGGVKLYDGDYLAVGATATQTTKPTGGYAHCWEALGGVYLYLNNFTSTADVICAFDNITVSLIGENTLGRMVANGITSWRYNELYFSGSGSLTISNDSSPAVTADLLYMEGGKVVLKGSPYGVDVARLRVRGGELVLEGSTAALSEQVDVLGGKAYVDANGTTWDNKTDLHTYPWLRFTKADHIVITGFHAAYRGVGDPEVFSDYSFNWVPEECYPIVEGGLNGNVLHMYMDSVLFYNVECTNPLSEKSAMDPGDIFYFNVEITGDNIEYRVDPTKIDIQDVHGRWEPTFPYSMNYGYQNHSGNNEYVLFTIATMVKPTVSQIYGNCFVYDEFMGNYRVDRIRVELYKVGSDTPMDTKYISSSYYSFRGLGAGYYMIKAYAAGCEEYTAFVAFNGTELEHDINFQPAQGDAVLSALDLDITDFDIDYVYDEDKTEVIGHNWYIFDVEGDVTFRSGSAVLEDGINYLYTDEEMTEYLMTEDKVLPDGIYYSSIDIFTSQRLERDSVDYSEIGVEDISIYGEGCTVTPLRIEPLSDEEGIRIFVSIDTGRATQRPNPDYIINSLTVSSTGGSALTSIPKGEFLATVSLTKNNGDSDAFVMLAAYTAQGQYQGLMWVEIEELDKDGTVKVTIPVDNADGQIANLKAFAVGSFNSLVPLGDSVSFLP